MKTIEIEDDLYKYILANIEEFGETPSQILRRLLVLSPIEENAGPIIDPIQQVPKLQIKTPVEKPAAQPSITLACHPSLPEHFAGGINALFDHPSFKTEGVITNKFKMMLTTMYYENKAAFITAANAAKGRSRAYLGQNLDQLLVSDNKEELALLIASKPRDIPYTPFWVVTNANTGRKRIILTQMMASMGYPHSLIERIKDEI